MPLRLTVSVWFVFLGLFSGCAGMRELDFVTGQCAEERDRCVAEQCGQVIDPVPCEQECAYFARTCERRQGTEGRPRARLGDDQAFLLDLRGKKPMHSSALQVQTGGEITPAEGHHTLSPGAFYTLQITLPPLTRQAEVVLTHRPGGTPCYITLTAGGGTLLGRYQPAQSPRMKAEVFDITKHLPPVEPGAPVPVTLTVFNNDAAGSRVPYHLAEVQVFYRVLEKPPEN